MLHRLSKEVKHAFSTESWQGLIWVCACALVTHSVGFHVIGYVIEKAYIWLIKPELPMATEKKSPTWLKDLLVAFAATTLSIILTFGTTGVINRVKQKQERKLTALMVMGSIEQFARDLELIEKDMAYRDSIAAWLLSIPVKDVAKLGDEPFKEALQEVYDLALINRDKTAETIFGSHIDTWKSMGNFKFIDNVGWCFSYMDYIENVQYYNC